MDMLPVAIFWALVLWGLLSPKPHILLYIFFASMSFGSFAAVPTALTGGLTFTPTPMVALMIILRTLANGPGISFAVRMAIAPRGLMLLFLFWVVAVVVTLFMPRIFAGQVDIIPMRAALLIQKTVLQPTTQNMSQLAYMTISVAAVFAFARMLKTPDIRQHMLGAMALGGAMVVLSGGLDFISQYVPIKPLLEPFRTASYALMTDVEVLGAKRVVGLMPEASAYGGLSLTFLAGLYFLRRTVTNPWLRDRAMPVIIGLLLAMVWMSTSSAAYVGLAVFVLAAIMDWSLRTRTQTQGSVMARGLKAEFWLAGSALIGLCVVMITMPALLDPAVEMIDAIVFQKSKSSSFEERSYWTATSWQALLDTYGLGVGIGGTRASNGLVAVFSSTGFVGGLLLYGFIAQTMLRRSAGQDEAVQAMINAVRWSFLPGFTTGLLAGTTPDFGTWGGMMFGLAVAASVYVSSTQTSSPAYYLGRKVVGT